MLRKTEFSRIFPTLLTCAVLSHAGTGIASAQSGAGAASSKQAGTSRSAASGTGSAPAAAQAASVPAVEEEKSINFSILTPSTAEYTIPAMTGDKVYLVDRGLHKTIEVAIAQHIINEIRSRYPDNIQWQPMRTGVMVKLSMKPADNERAVDFLHYDLFGFKIQ